MECFYHTSETGILFLLNPDCGFRQWPLWNAAFPRTCCSAGERSLVHLLHKGNAIPGRCLPPCHRWGPSLMEVPLEVFSSVSLYSLLKAFHALRFLTLTINFLLDLTTLPWLPFWSIHLTACLCSTLAYIVQFSATDAFERRPLSEAEQNYLVFPHWNTCWYIQYKTYLSYSNKIFSSCVQPVAHFSKTPPDLIIPWCGCA